MSDSPSPTPGHDVTPPCPRGVDCGTAVRQLWDYLDGSLDAERMALIKSHIDACPHCFPHADFARTFLGAVQQVRHDMRQQTEPQADASGMRQRVLTALRAEGYDGP